MSLPPNIFDRFGGNSFGGSQMWLPDDMLLNSGCGIIAGLDAVMRLKGEESMERDAYIDRFFVAKDYIRPLTIGKNREERKLFGQEFHGSFGVSAGRFKRGVKKLAVKEGIKVRVKPFRFRWWKKLPKYLESGDPVVMLFTAPIRNVAVVSKNGHKTMCNYHWVTVTEMDGDTLTVSSWGAKCTMSVKDLRRFDVMVHFYSVTLEKQSDLV